MKNDLPPALLFEISLTINCELNLPGLIQKLDVHGGLDFVLATWGNKISYLSGEMLPENL